MIAPLHRPRSSRTLVAAGLFAAIFVDSAHAQTESRVLAGDRVAIYNLAGRLRVQPGTGSGVTVQVTRAGRDASRLTLATGDVKGFTALRVVYPSDRIIYPESGYRSRTELRVNEDGTFDDGRDWSRRNRVEIRDSGSGLEAHADMVVSVPAGRRLSVHWGTGEATVSNVDGDIRISVATARVQTDRTRGVLHLDTGSGSVSVSDAQGEVHLDTGSGSVTVDGVRGEVLSMDTGSGSLSASSIDVKTLKADVGSGGLRLDRISAPRVDLDAGSGSVMVDLLSIVEHLVVDAGSGGVTIRLPAAQGAEVDIETGSGGIESDFAVQTTRFGRNALRGTIGDGRGRIRIESGSGRVRLLKR